MLRLFGLLHVDAGETRAINDASGSFRDQIAVYLGNACCLAASLRQRGIAFTLLTNRSALLRELLPAGSSLPEIVEIRFRTRVPRGVRFYSAHFKFDAFDHLSKCAFPYVGLCDLDMVCNNKLPTCLANLVADRTPLFYDITAQVSPAYGHDVIIRDLQALHGQPSEGRWAGGEFIAGPPSFFAQLCSHADAMFDTYIAALPGLHHVGDEALTSAALELMRGQGIRMADAGTLGIVARYWNERTDHPQPPLRALAGTFLLHLPSDKRFLAQLGSSGPGTSEQFLRRYAIHRGWSADTVVRWCKRQFRRLAPGMTAALRARAR